MNNDLSNLHLPGIDRVSENSKPIERVRFAIGEGGMNSESRKLMSVAVVPAQADTVALENFFDNDGVSILGFCYRRVIAWRIMTYKAGESVYDEVYAVRYAHSPSERVSIEHPDGTIADCDGNEFSSIDLYKDHLNRKVKVNSCRCACGEC